MFHFHIKEGISIIKLDNLTPETFKFNKNYIFKLVIFHIFDFIYIMD